MLVKVCGLKEEKNIKEVLSFGVNYFGLINYKKSPRFVSLDEIIKLTEDIDTRKKAVVVSVDEEINFFKKLESIGILNFQLHGREEIKLVKEIKETIKGSLIFKALHMSDISTTEELFNQVESYKDFVDFIILDSGGFSNKKIGGTGEKFNWKLISDLNTSAQIILSGGINPQDSDLVSKYFLSCNNLSGIDLNSGFETSPGHKNINSLLKFLSRIR